MLRLALIFSVVVVLFDIVCATIAKLASITYANFLILSFVLYVALGIFAGRKLRHWQRAMFAIAVAAVADATVGWYATWLIGPGSLPNGATFVEILTGVVFAVAGGLLFGAIGVALGIRAARAAL